MRAQRLPAQPRASSPRPRPAFDDLAFDAAMAVLSDHHWRDPIGGLREMARVARRVVVFQFDGARSADFWLVRDYLPSSWSSAAVNRRCGSERRRSGQARAGHDPMGSSRRFLSRVLASPPRIPPGALPARDVGVGAGRTRRRTARRHRLGAELESGAWEERNATCWPSRPPISAHAYRGRDLSCRRSVLAQQAAAQAPRDTQYLPEIRSQAR